MNTQNRNQVVSFNLRGWPLNHARFTHTIACLAKKLNAMPDTSVASLSEMVPGKNSFYVRQLLSLLDDRWELVLPMDYNIDTHWRSAVNIMLIRKTAVVSVGQLQITDTGAEDFAGLYVYVKVVFAGEREPVYVLGTHQVQLDNGGKPLAYQIERSNLAADFWNAVIRELQSRKGEKMLFLGDHNAERGFGVNSDKIAIVEQLLADTYVGRDDGVTYTDPNGKGHRYDHAYSNFGGMSYIDLDPTEQGYSDHNAVVYTYG